MSEPVPLTTGGCQCGAVRYRLLSRPVASVCHCRMCQKAVGGPFAALAEVPIADLVWTRGAPALFDSSSVACRGFCQHCGTPLTYQGRTIDGSRIEVTIGSLDEPGQAAPGHQFGAEAMIPWFETLHTVAAAATEAKFSGVVSFQHPDHDT